MKSLFSNIILILVLEIICTLTVYTQNFIEYPQLEPGDKVIKHKAYSLVFSDEH